MLLMANALIFDVNRPPADDLHEIPCIFFLNEETTFENIISLQFLKLKYLKGIVCYY